MSPPTCLKGSKLRALCRELGNNGQYSSHPTVNMETTVSEDPSLGELFVVAAAIIR